MDAHARSHSSGDARLNTMREYLMADLQHLRKRQQVIADMLSASQPEVSENSEHFKQVLSTSSGILVPTHRPPQHREDGYPTSIKATDAFDELFNELDTLQADSHALALQYRGTLASIRRSGQRVPIRVEQQFPRFKELPAELRVMIWKYSLHLVVLNAVKPGPQNPAMAYACRESRAIFLQLCSVPKDPLDDQSGTTVVSQYRVQLFTSSIDSVYLSYINRPEPRTRASIPVSRCWGPRTAELIVQASWTASQVLDIPVRSYRCHGGFHQEGEKLKTTTGIWWRSRHFEYLPPVAFVNKTISILPGSSSYVQQSWGRPDLVHDLFQGRRFLVLDLQDREEVARVARILRQFRQEWAAIGGINYRVDQKLGCPEEDHIIAIDEGRGDWEQWNTARRGIMERLAETVAANWLPLNNFSDFQERRDYTSTHKITAEQKQAAMGVLAGTRLRLVHVMEVEGPNPREVVPRPR